MALSQGTRGLKCKPRKPKFGVGRKGNWNVWVKQTCATWGEETQRLQGRAKSQIGHSVVDISSKIGEGGVGWVRQKKKE